jgi:hypothetical protein
MKNKLDKHIDSKLKDCFESVQNKAPEHLWENISSELENDQVLDESIDKKVEDSYLNLTEKTAPAFLWNSINEGLHDVEETIDNSLDSKLKESYDKQVVVQTPNSVWYAISQQLNVDNTWNKISKVLDLKPVVSD